VQLFVSYARLDRLPVETLAIRLRQVGADVWLDSDLVGGQAWWDRILSHLRSCDAVVAVMSRAAIKSQTCRSEREYATRLGKSILPIVIEPMSAEMFPADIARMQFIDYTRPDDAAAFRLAGAIFALPNPRPLPAPLPAPPPLPQTRYGNLPDLITAPNLTLEQQLGIIGVLKEALGPASGPDDQRTAAEMLAMLAGRQDLYVASARKIETLQSGVRKPPGQHAPDPGYPMPSVHQQQTVGYPAADRDGFEAEARTEVAQAHASPDIEPALFSAKSAIQTDRQPESERSRNAEGQARPDASVGCSTFVSYSQKDERYRQRLDIALSQLQRSKLISVWYDRKILPGQEWDREIDKNLESADIILLLISPDFIASDYAYGREMERAVQRHQSGSAKVVPIILRPCDWQSSPFGMLQALPSKGRPVSNWANRDQAWLDVVQGLRRLISSQG